MPHSNVTFLRHYLNEGGRLILVSGRNCAIYPRIARKVKHKITLLACNGAFTYNGEKRTDEHPLDNKELLRLCTFYMRRYGVLLWMLFDGENHMYVCSSPEIPKYVTRITRVGNGSNGFFRENMIFGEETFFHHLENGKNFKLLLTLGVGDNGAAISKEMAYAIKDRFKEFSVAYSSNAVELTAKGVDKGVCLSQYCKEQGIAKDEVFVCGDSGNDLAMFACFPHTFAMSHAEESFKEQANHVIDRISDLEPYLQDESKIEKDQIKVINYEKSLETL